MQMFVREFHCHSMTDIHTSHRCIRSRLGNLLRSPSDSKPLVSPGSKSPYKYQGAAGHPFGLHGIHSTYQENELVLTDNTAAVFSVNKGADPVNKVHVRSNPPLEVLHQQFHQPETAFLSGVQNTLADHLSRSFTGHHK